jgi:hypothetical protein
MTWPTVTFDFDGVAVTVPAEQLATVVDRWLAAQHTVQWGHIFHLDDEARRAAAAMWLLDELGSLAGHAAVDPDTRLELTVS